MSEGRGPLGHAPPPWAPKTPSNCECVYRENVVGGRPFKVYSSLELWYKGQVRYGLSGTMKKEGATTFYTVRRAIFLMPAALGGGPARWNVAIDSVYIGQVHFAAN